MSARKAFPALLAAVVSAPALAPVMASANAWLPQPGEYYSEFRARYESASRFFDEEGISRRFPGDGMLEVRELISYNELGWKKGRSLIFSVPATSVTYRLGAPPFSSTQTGLSDVVMGLRVRLLDGATGLTAEAQWKAPLGYARDHVPRLGEGQQDLFGRINFGTAIEPLGGFTELSWSYRYRFEDPLDEIIHTADLGFWLGSSLLIEGGYRGVYSVGVGKPEFVDFDYHVLGPRLTYRLDDHLDLFAGSNHVLWGTRASRSEEYYVGMAVKQTRLNRLQGFLGGKRRP